jgi:hypothetical protein
MPSQANYSGRSRSRLANFSGGISAIEAVFPPQLLASRLFHHRLKAQNTNNLSRLSKSARGMLEAFPSPKFTPEFSPPREAAMQRCALNQVDVWLDDFSNGEGALLEAMDWACRLGLPLRVIARSARVGGPAPVVERISAWGAACAQRGIAMETLFWAEEEMGFDQLSRSGSLCVFEDVAADPVRDKLLARSTRDPEVPVLVAARVHRPMNRVLVVCHDHQANPTFLESAARLCRALNVPPLILTVASSDRQARRGQSFAEDVCASLRLQADFDSVAGLDYRSAAKRVAAWRHCSHVIVERPRCASLWQRLGGDAFSELRSLSGSLAVLGLPGSVTLEVPQEVESC